MEAKEMNAILSYFYDWVNVPENEIDPILGEFEDAGAKFLTLVDGYGKMFLQDANVLAKWSARIAAHGLGMRSCHGLWAGIYDLVWPEGVDKDSGLDAHKHFMREASICGSMNYTVHTGHTPAGMAAEEGYKNIFKALDVLLPEAEKCGITISVENGWQIDLPVSIQKIIRHYQTTDTPLSNLGVCLDIGHANLQPGRVYEAFSLLAPYVVTSHLHDNDGVSDLHRQPGTGAVDWSFVAKALAECPRLQTVENETSALRLKVPIDNLCHQFQSLLG